MRALSRSQVSARESESILLPRMQYRNVCIGWARTVLPNALFTTRIISLASLADRAQRRLTILHIVVKLIQGAIQRNARRVHPVPDEPLVYLCLIPAHDGVVVGRVLLGLRECHVVQLRSERVGARVDRSVGIVLRVRLERVQGDELQLERNQA